MESSSASASTPAEDAEEKIPVDLLGLADELSMWNPRSFRHYDVLKFIDKGSHMIYKGRERKTGQLVALKVIKRDGERLIPLDAQSEIVMLNFLKHENIIRLKEIAMSPVHGNDEQGKPDVKYRGNAYMVFEYMEHDLFCLVMRKGAQFTVPQIKRISAEQALDADYFREDPRPCDRQSLPKYPETHRFQPPRKRQRPDSQEKELAAGPEMRPPADQEAGVPDATDRQRHG